MTALVTPLRRLLVPLDFTPDDGTIPGERLEAEGHPLLLPEPSVRALALAATLARCHGSSLSLVHAVRPLAEGPMYRGPVSVPALLVQDLQSRALERGMKVLRDLCDRCCPDLTVDVYVRTGQARAVILEESRRQDIDLIVMAASSRGRLERWFVGSTVDHIIREATCPVTVIPPLAPPPRDPA